VLFLIDVLEGLQQSIYICWSNWDSHGKQKWLV